MTKPETNALSPLIHPKTKQDYIKSKGGLGPSTGQKQVYKVTKPGAKLLINLNQRQRD